MRELKNNKFIGKIFSGLSLFLLVSCSSSPENLTSIPKDTNVVVVVDILSIIKKGNLEEISELKMFKSFKKEVRNEKKKISKMIDKVIEDPTVSGIDFTSDMFAYYVNESSDEEFFCVSIAIDNEEDFAGFVEDFLDKARIEFDIEKEKDYSYTLAGRKMAIGWDQAKAVIIVASNRKSRENLDSEIETLFSLKDEGQISSRNEFNEFYSNKGDVSLWFSSNLFIDSRWFERMGEEIEYDLEDNYGWAFLNFGENDMSLRAQIKYNEEIQKTIDDNNIWGSGADAKLLKFFPKESYASASIGINPNSYYNIFEKEDNFENIEEEFERETGLNLKDAFESVNGNAIFSLFGFEEIEYNYLDWGYGFNESISEKLDEKYEIEKAGYLSADQKESLNLGKTIKCSEFDGRYCINIKNILDDGGSVESAIRDNSKMNWYEGGWEQGRYVEVARKEPALLMGLAIDINGTEVIETLIEKIPENELVKRDDYYELIRPYSAPVYFAFNENLCFVTNDEKSVKSFDKGGYDGDNLGDADIASDLTNSSFYSFVNLDEDDYPKLAKKLLKKSQSNKEEKMFKIWSELAKSAELKQIDNTLFELTFNTKNTEGNSLEALILAIDQYYRKLM